jgi:site-specific recombinase XerD
MELFDQFTQEQRYIKNLSEHTIYACGTAFRAWTRLIGKELPTKPQGVEFIMKLKQAGVQASTINAYIRSMNSYFGWLAENEFIQPFSIKEIKADCLIHPHFYGLRLWPRQQHCAYVSQSVCL